MKIEGHMLPREISQANERGVILIEELAKKLAITQSELAGLDQQGQVDLVSSKLDQLPKAEQEAMLKAVAEEQRWTKDGQMLQRAEDKLKLFKDF